MAAPTQAPARTSADQSTLDCKLIKRARYHAVRSFDSLLDEPPRRRLFHLPGDSES